MTIQTKNLGLIKAIHVGTNPPMNTKILWFNDSNNPYTTGPAKVHYYYDVSEADWMPLQSSGSGGDGNFTYIAFATSCEGADFSLVFNVEEHTHWAIINSDTEIETPLPEMFEGRWTGFCTGASIGGNYTYVAFSDCGENFSEELTYEAECEECILVDTFTEDVIHPAFATAQVGDSLVVVITDGAAGQTSSLDLEKGGAPLTDLVLHCIEVVVDSINQPLRINLGYPGEHIDIPAVVGTYKKKILTLNSKLNITISAEAVGSVSAEFQITVGNKECCDADEGGMCTKCRTHFGILTSPTPIEELTVEMFEGKWIPLKGGGCGCGDESTNTTYLDDQIEALNNIINDYISTNNVRVTNLESTVVSLQSQINALQILLENKIETVEDNFIDATDAIDEQLLIMAGQINTNSNDIDVLEGQLEVANLNDTLEPFIDLKLATYTSTTLDAQLTGLQNLLEGQIESVQINIDNLTGTLSSEVVTLNLRIDSYHPEPPIE